MTQKSITSAFSTLSYRKTMLGVLLILALLAVPFVALADYVVIDDLVLESTTIVSGEYQSATYSMNLGQICEGASVSQNIVLRIERQNGGGEMFKPDGTVIIVAQTPTGAPTLSATMQEDNSIILPSNWGPGPGGTNHGGKSSDSAQATLTATANGPLGINVASVAFTATGPNNTGSGGTLARTSTVNVNWEVISCGDTWTTSGFKSPVKPGVNKIKAGSTVPLKFNVYKNDVEETDPSVVSVSVALTGGCASTPSDPIETLSNAGSTILRYADGEFIQNWKTPAHPGACYTVTVTAGNASNSALFELR